MPCGALRPHGWPRLVAVPDRVGCQRGNVTEGSWHRGLATEAPSVHACLLYRSLTHLPSLPLCLFLSACFLSLSLCCSLLLSFYLWGQTISGILLSCSYLIFILQTQILFSSSFSLSLFFFCFTAPLPSCAMHSARGIITGTTSDFNEVAIWPCTSVHL